MDTWEHTLQKVTESVAAAIIKVSQMNQLSRIKPSAYFLKDDKLTLFHPGVMAQLVERTEDTAMQIHYSVKEFDPDYMVMVLPMLMHHEGKPESVMVLNLESRDKQVFMYFGLQQLFDNLAMNKPEVVWNVMDTIDKKNATTTVVLGPLLDIFGTGSILALPPVVGLKSEILPAAMIV